MGFPVAVYIYDLSQGMARQMGQALIGREVEGIWHTAVVVHGKEYFYGGGGIESCPPGGTQLGQPLRVEQVGETEIDPVMLAEYLSAQGRDRFRGDRYDLLQHNCNNFSHETAQFLTGRGIPQHILDLPREVMSTPLGQMLAPMLQQMAPSGQSIPFTAPPPAAAPPPPAAPEKLFPVKDFITFEAPLKVDGLAKKLEEFNGLEGPATRLAEEEVLVVVGVAKGLVRLSPENLAVLLKVHKWAPGRAFPLLDILRAKCVKPSLWSEPASLQAVVDLLLASLQPDQAVEAMVACKALANLAAAGGLALPALEAVLAPLPALLPAASPGLETALASLLSNLSVLLLAGPSLEQAVLLGSSLASSVLLDLTQDESVYRCLVSLGNTLHAAREQEEVRQLLQSMETGELVAGLAGRGGKVRAIAGELQALLEGRTH